MELEHYYDKLAFWEMSSFIYFLETPRIGMETLNSDGLYYAAEHTFLSPYTWDPYGLQPRVSSYIYKNHKTQHSLRAYMQIIDKKYQSKGEEVAARDYLTAIWAALSIAWVVKNRQPAPIDYWQLLGEINDVELKKAMLEWNKIFFAESTVCLKLVHHPYRKLSKEKVRKRRNVILDNFIMASYQTASVFLNEIGDGSERCKEMQEINALYDAITRAMNPPNVYGIT